MINGNDFKGLSQTLMSTVQEDQACSNAVRLPHYMVCASRKQNGYVHAWGLHEKRLQVAFRGKALTIVSLLWRFAPTS